MGAGRGFVHQRGFWCTNSWGLFDRAAHLGGFGVGGVQLEDHKVVVLLGAGGPFAAVGTVGIAVLGKVGPGGDHLLGEVPVPLRPGAPAVLEGLEHEPKVR